MPYRFKLVVFLFPMLIPFQLLLSPQSVQAQQASNFGLTLVAHLNQYPQIGYNDVWGYTAPDGRDYALLGVRAGISIVDATDSASIHEVDYIPWVGSLWYDMKTYRHYMYVCSEGSTEILIVDLATLPDSAHVVGTYVGLTSTPHNIFVDTTQALLFVVEDLHFDPAVRILSLADPEHPVQVSVLGPGLGTDAHDLFSQDSVLYVAEGINGSIGIFDIHNPAAPTLIQRLFIPAPGYVHNVWVTKDNQYMVTTEETTNKTVKIWDIRDLNNIQLVAEYLGENGLAHNAFFKDDLLYISHYASGAKLVDVQDMTSPIEIGSFDTQNDWGVYPYTSNGYIYVSDMDNGLYVLNFTGSRAYRLTGVLTDATTGNPIADGWIEIADNGTVVRTAPDGHYATGIAASGSITLHVAAFGFQSQTLTITARSGEIDTLNFQLSPLPTSSIGGVVNDQNNQPLAGARVVVRLNSPLLSTPQLLADTTDSNGEFNFDHILVSDSVWLNYDSLWVEQIFPFPTTGHSGVVTTVSNPAMVQFQLQPADVFLVNGDPAGNYLEKYESALVANQTTYFVWTTATDGTQIPVSRMDELKTPTIIWYTGDATTNVLNVEAQDSLRQFLAQGGRLFLTGQNIAQDLANQGSSFLSGDLQVGYGGIGGPPVIRPVQSHPLAAGLANISTAGSNQNSKDILQPTFGSFAQPAFTYTNGLPAGVTLELAGSGAKVVFFGFGMEGMAENSTNASREEVMGRVLGWLGSLPTGIDDPSPVQPEAFVLLPNFPNPFNPSTTIRYQLGEPARISLRIFDTLGQTIRTLVAGNQQGTGQHQVRWDGTDDHGQPVSSGIYIYQLEARTQNGRSFRAAREMLLLK